jgi:hypothetical protein
MAKEPVQTRRGPRPGPRRLPLQELMPAFFRRLDNRSHEEIAADSQARFILFTMKAQARIGARAAKNGLAAVFAPLVAGKRWSEIPLRFWERKTAKSLESAFKKTRKAMPESPEDFLLPNASIPRSFTSASAWTLSEMVWSYVRYGRTAK